MTASPRRRCWFFENDMDVGYEFWETVFDSGVRMDRSNSPLAEALETDAARIA